MRILDVVQGSTKGHGGTIIVIRQILMGNTLLATILRLQMELNGLHGIDLTIR